MSKLAKLEEQEPEEFKKSITKAHGNDVSQAAQFSDAVRDAFIADPDSVCDHVIEKYCEGTKICAKRCTLFEQNRLSGAKGDNRQQYKLFEFKMDDRAANPDFLVSLPLNQWIGIDEKVSFSLSESIIKSGNLQEWKDLCNSISIALNAIFHYRQA
jgi:hypothetical protein